MTDSDGTRGGFKLLAFTVPLVLMAPFWILAVRAARRSRADQEAE